MTGVDVGRAEEVGMQELATLMQGRAATYDMLSRLFLKEVDQDYFDALCAMLFPAQTGDVMADAGVRRIVDYLSGSWENTLVDLAVDYARTFLTHGIDSYSAAYPFESVYTSKHRLLMQDAYTDVLAQYRSAGVVRDASVNIEEDHIALELEFMGILCARAAAAADSCDEEALTSCLEAQRGFLARHLANWVPRFISDMRRFAQTDFYLGLADYLEGFLRMDAALLDEVCGEGRASDASL